MALDSRYSVEAGLLDERDHAAIIGLLGRLGLPSWHASLRAPALLDGLTEFREHLGGELCITLLAGIGQPIEAHEMRDDLVRRAIDALDRDVARAAG
jgi:3-dehydroquinate synthase